MNFLRKHWYDLGVFLAIIAGLYIFIYHRSLTPYQIMVWVSLIALFLHQAEEYRLPGTFPGMINTVMYRSNMPDRYPLNTNTAFFVNVAVGWTAYFLAAILAEKAVWLGIATILVSAGNVTAHTFIFNVKGRTIYNAGLATCWLFFVPCTCFFFSTIHTSALATAADYWIGIPAGIILNFAGIIKLIDWMADRDTKFIFEQRNLLRKGRK